MHKLIIISAPSGCGKSSLVKALIQNNPNIKVSISHTTRTKRDYEKEAVDYFFIGQEKFNLMIENNEFVEYAKVFDNYYGTSKKSLNKTLENNDVLIEIDWQGARQIKKNFNNVISIFILPPSIEELENRLVLRGDDKELIARRMLDAEKEISHQYEYDHKIVNDDFDIALEKIENIING